MSEPRIIIAGSRDFNDYDYLKEKCLWITNLKNPEIVSGHARGADSLGERFAKEYGIRVKVFQADWSRFGKRAGPLRNSQMIDYVNGSKEKYLIAFPRGSSIGTYDTIRKAEEKGFQIFVW